MKYSYASEKFNRARSCLMLPHSRGEAASIADAFHECHLGLHELDRTDIDDHATSLLRKLDSFMDTSGVHPSSGEGQWQAKAEAFSRDEKVELSNIIDELAYMFDDQG